MEELKVENVIIGRQFEDSENLQKFLKIIKERNIPVNVVEVGTKINIEKDLYFNVIWPNSESIISENSLNNNSLVCKLHYKNFSMLFTGDIEEITEERLAQMYKKSNELESTVIKVAHHGSNSSSTQEFIELVKPKMALIAVSKNNLYGHPNSNILARFEGFRCKNF